ncbi:MAG: transposase [Moraxella sp.]
MGKTEAYQCRALYYQKQGCQWRMLPNDFPPYPTVWSFYRRANQAGFGMKYYKH